MLVLAVLTREEQRWLHMAREHRQLRVWNMDLGRKNDVCIPASAVCQTDR